MTLLSTAPLDAALNYRCRRTMSRLLHELAPGAQRIAFLLNKSNPNHLVYWAAAQTACAAG